MFREEYQAVCGAAKKKVEFLEKNPLGYVTAAFLAGMFIGLGCVLMGVVGGYFNAAGSPATKLLNGLVFAVGLNFVFMAGAELFTGNNFTMSAASIKGEVSWGKTIKVWIVCYLGNLLGSVVTAGIFMMTRTDERTGSRNVLEKCGSGESLRSSDGAFCKSDLL